MNDWVPCFVYGLSSSEDGVIRYIGQSRDSPQKRLRGHLVDARRKTSTHKRNWIRGVQTAGFEVEITILKDDAAWHLDEREFIRKYREDGHRLVNSTDGGEGMLNPTPELKAAFGSSWRGKKRPPATIERMRLAKLGKNNPLFGTSPSPETAIKKIEYLKHRRHPNFGKPLSDETKKKLSASMTGRKGHWAGRTMPDEIRLKISLTLKGRDVRKEARRRTLDQKIIPCYYRSGGHAIPSWVRL